MRLLLLMILTAALLFGGYWVFAAQMIERQGSEIMDNSAQLDGRLQPVTGFPLNFRTTIEAPVWRSRDGLSGWAASELALTSASHQPNRINATFPASQTLRLGGIDMTLEARDMRGTLALGADQSLRAADLQVAGSDLGPAAPVTGMGGTALALHQIDGPRYAFDAQIQDLRLTSETLALVSPDASLPEHMDLLALRAEAEFARPLPVQMPWPELQALDVIDARLDWGPLQASMTGRLTRNATGMMEGQIQLVLQDWRPFHTLLIANGILPPDAAMLAGMFLAGQAAPGTHSVTLPLDLRDQVLSLGPFALAQLPRF